MPRPLLPALCLTLLAGPALAVCHEGPTGAAYDLGQSLAFQGVPTTAAQEVAEPLHFCFAAGYREGTLQRLIRTSQPNPPMQRAVRPRTAHAG